MFTAIINPLPPMSKPAAPTVTNLGSGQGIDVGQLIEVGPVATDLCIGPKPTSSLTAAKSTPNKSATTSSATHRSASNPTVHPKGSEHPTMTADTSDQPAPLPSATLRPDQQPVGR